MTDYLLTANAGTHEVHFGVPEGPLDPTLTAVGLTFAHMRKTGLKVAYLFLAGEDRWLVRLEMP